MKKIVFSLSFIAVAMFAFIACEKDPVSPLDTQTTEVEYTVLVVDGATALKSSAGLDGVAVTISSQGQQRTATTGSSGQATFSGLKPGAVAVSISKDGYIDIGYIADLTPDNASGYDNIANRSAATKISMISSAATSMGTVIGEVEKLDSANFAGDVYQDASGVSIIARFNSAANIVTSIGSDGSVSNVTFGAASITATTGTDGSYTLSLPTVLGGVTYTLSPQPTIGIYYDETDDSNVTENQSVAQATVTVYPGETEIQDFTMNP